MKKTSLIFSILLFSLSVNACVKKNIVTNSNQEPQAIIVATTPPPNVTLSTPSSEKYHQLQTIRGTLLSIRERSNGFVFPQYKNKIVLLQIFGQDCPYCFKEMPIINSLKRKYSRKLQVIALQAQETMSKEVASNLIQRFQMNYPIIDKDEARGLLYVMNSTYGWNGILPYILLIKNGVTEYSFSGEVAYEELNEAMQSLM